MAHPVLEHGLRLEAGMLLDFGGEGVDGVLEVAQPTWWLAVARDLSARPVSALQVVLSDENGRLPGMRGHDGDFVQPLLGNAGWTVPGWVAPKPVAVFEPPTCGDSSATL